MDSTEFKQTLKEALTEVLNEQRELRHEVFAEVVEDFALVKAVREGQDTRKVSRKQVFGILRGEE